jgi:hypothetical protein
MTIFLGITWVAVLVVSYFAAVALLKKLHLY